MSKTKKSVLNLIASVTQVVIAQVITLVVSRKVLTVYGSDINGVNAVFTNTLVWLMLIEGGFTFASSVALFKAFAAKDIKKVNGILSATKKVLNKIGIYVGLGGIALSFIAPFFIKTSLSFELMVSMFLLMAFGSFFGLFFTRKYALMFAVKQEDYFKVYIGILVSIIVNIGIYIVAIQQVNYLWVRVLVALGVVLTGILTYILVKRKYPTISYNKPPDVAAIKGTRDMVFNKFASLLNSSAPLIYIAAVVGASYASVYAVYMIVFGFITKLNMMLANAVQNGFGQYIAEKSPNQVYSKFRIFEYSIILTAFTLISTAAPVTMPFINFYTKNVNDVNYIEWSYLFLFIAITLVKIIHIPSGIIMLMSGAFKKSRKIQINALCILILGIILGGFFYRVNGILLGILIAAIVLGIQEIYFTRVRYFEVDFMDLFKMLFIIGITSITIIFTCLKYIPIELSFQQIMYYAVFLAVLNIVIMVSVSYIFFRKIFLDILKIITGLLKKNK